MRAAKWGGINDVCSLTGRMTSRDVTWPASKTGANWLDWEMDFKYKVIKKDLDRVNGDTPLFTKPVLAPLSSYPASGRSATADEVHGELGQDGCLVRE